MRSKVFLLLLGSCSLLQACQDDCAHPIEAEAQTLVLQPDAATAKDATIWSYQPTNNYGAHPQILGSAWTFDGSPGALRSLFQFDLNEIPAGAEIESATLSLYHHIANNNTGHSGQNAATLKRITEAWAQDAVTWNTQPATSTQNQVVLPASTSGTQDYLNIDMTALVKDSRANPGSSFGFLLQLQVEEYYRSLVFASSDIAEAGKRPKLTITYKN